jgi:hypothetical protein
VLSTPEGRAWGILLTAFAIFCILIVSVPLSIRWYLLNATVAHDTILEEPIDGTVFVQEPRGTELIATTHRREDISEGTTIATDEHLRAFLRLYDGSTLTLDYGTRIVLERVRSPRFGISSRTNEIRIRVEQGQVAIGVGAPMQRPLHMAVTTPHAGITLQEGSFAVTVEPDQTQLTIRAIRPGEATIVAGDESLSFTSGRSVVISDPPIGVSAIQGPLPPDQDLIVNGSFDSVLDRGWEPPQQQRDAKDPLGDIEIAPLGGKSVLRFSRYGAETHGETSITQIVDQDVHGFSSLKLAFEVLVDWQSLPGGGYKSTEFPIMVELKYRDPMGNSRSRYWGFYYKDPGEGPEWLTMVNGLKVVQGEWYPFQSDNLLQAMGDIRPEHVESVRVYASGWEWNSAITNISLLVQQ